MCYLTQLYDLKVYYPGLLEMFHGSVCLSLGCLLFFWTPVDKNSLSPLRDSENFFGLLLGDRIST